MRLALLADIHGNLPALNAVLEDAKLAGVTDYLCLGDVANLGPNPSEVLDLIKQLNCPVIMGNTDYALISPLKISQAKDEASQFSHDLATWCAAQLSDVQKRYVAQFQTSHTMTIATKIILAYHGSPLSYNDYITAQTTDETLEQLLTPVADLYIGGHTHEQFIRRFANARVMNPGSVGIAFYKPRNSDTFINFPVAEYAILEAQNSVLNLTFKRVPYSFQKLKDLVQASSMPHQGYWLESFETSAV